MRLRESGKMFRARLDAHSKRSRARQVAHEIGRWDFMAGGVTAVQLDMSDLQSKIEMLRNNMSQKRFENAMYGIIRDTSRHIKAILKADIPIEYYFKKGEIGKAVKGPQMSFGANGSLVSAAIPVTGARYTIGGNHVSAQGGWPGWGPPPYRISFNIVTQGTSVLPARLKNYGGQPAWRNTAIRKKKGMAKAAFTRAGKSRLPIMPVKTIAIPQAITNRSEEDIAKDTLEYMGNRLDHRITAMLKLGR